MLWASPVKDRADYLDVCRLQLRNRLSGNVTWGLASLDDWDEAIRSVGRDAGVREPQSPRAVTNRQISHLAHVDQRLSHAL